MRIARPHPALVVTGLAFVAVACLVATRTLDHFDDAAGNLFWPGHEWGATQRMADRIINMLAPERLGAATLLISALVALRRRTVRPLLFVGAIVCLSAFGELAVKWAMPRIAVPSSDGHFAGSFPSGHMTAAIAFPGALALLLPRWAARAAWIGIALLSLLVAATLLVSATHYVTDIVGGALWATFVLVAAATVPTRLHRRGCIRVRVPSRT